jgi:lysophospholipase L1-like esterase
MMGAGVGKASVGASAKAPAVPRWLKFAIPLATLLLTFAFLEAGFRVTEAITTRPRSETWALYDQDLGYRPNPGFADTNAAGLRDHAVTPKAGRFRVLMLGDSLGYYGDSVDDTWVGRMRQQLQRAGGLAPFDILNGSVRGYTNYQELIFLKKYGVRLEPDLVGVGFVLNDLHHILHTFKIENGRIVGETYDFTPQAVASVDSMAFRLARQSRFLVWLRRSLAPAINSLQYRVGTGFAFDYRPDMSTAWKDSEWLTVKSQMEEMRALGVQNGFGLFMIVFPIADQYRPAYLAANRAYVLKPQQHAAELCAQLNIPCLDLYPALNPTYFLEDGIHLTAPGRQRVAEEVAAFLAERHLMPRSL